MEGSGSKFAPMVRRTERGNLHIITRDRHVVNLNGSRATNKAATLGNLSHMRQPVNAGL